jgi:hypothetical protein
MHLSNLISPSSLPTNKTTNLPMNHWNVVWVVGGFVAWIITLFKVD